MRTLLCCIGRKQNQYIREFVEYYKNLGFTNILLYDNNFDDEERFEDAIGDYIKDGFVIIKDYRNRRKAQFDAYYECWRNERQNYDWIAFFDCDEFLTFTEPMKIDEFLSSEKFAEKNAVVVNWKCYTDSGLVHNDGRACLERFTEEATTTDNNHIKSIVRCIDFNRIDFSTPHNTNLPNQCNADGEEHPINRPHHKCSFKTAYIRHYSTKTIDEYCDKMIIGTPDRIWNVKRDAEKYLKEKFFSYNIPTKEKIDVIKDKLKIDMSYLLK